MYENHTCNNCGEGFGQKVLSKVKHDLCINCRRNPIARRRKTTRKGNIRWSDAKRKQGLAEMVSRGYTPKEMVEENSRLYASIISKFGSIYDACEYYGLPHAKSGYTTVYQTAGFKFERLVGELLSELSFEYTKTRTGSCRPDFAVGNDWYDAKLSEWTINTCGTVEKYETHCNSLTIIYLRGRSLNKRISNKTHLVHVSKFVDMLPTHKRIYFNGKFDAIERELSEIEKSA